MKIFLTNDGSYAYASGSASAVGGTERDQWLLSRALAAAGWSVTVGVRAPMKAGEHRAIDGVEFVGIGQGQILLAWYRFLSSQRPHWWYWEGATHLWGFAVQIANLAGVRTIFSAASDVDVQPHHALLDRRRWWPLYALGLSRTDRIFVQHEGQLAALAPQWRSKAYILPKICILEAMKPHSERVKYVAWVAMLGQLKRPDLLIEIARKAPALRFVVCGGPTNFMTSPGYGKRIVDALCMTPNIEYLGQVPPKQAQQVIADAAILLSTSDVEGFPNTFSQAWSSGTPVVSLKIDPGHIIEQKGLGVVSSSVERAIVDITALMDSPERREDIAIRARRHVAEACNEAVVIRTFERALGVVRP
jgi:glycosyltransferase involved in cell wall biosynthesis